MCTECLVRCGQDDPGEQVRSLRVSRHQHGEGEAGIYGNGRTENDVSFSPLLCLSLLYFLLLSYFSSSLSFVLLSLLLLFLCCFPSPPPLPSFKTLFTLSPFLPLSLYRLQLADEHGVKFMETSAKSGFHVETVSHTHTHTHYVTDTKSGTMSL